MISFKEIENDFKSVGINNIAEAYITDLWIIAGKPKQYADLLNRLELFFTRRFEQNLLDLTDGILQRAIPEVMKARSISEPDAQRGITEIINIFETNEGLVKLRKLKIQTALIGSIDTNIKSREFIGRPAELFSNIEPGDMYNMLKLKAFFEAFFPLLNRIYERFTSIVGKDGYIIDLGCGFGSFRSMVSRRDQNRFLEIDTNSSVLAMEVSCIGELGYDPSQQASVINIYESFNKKLSFKTGRNRFHRVLALNATRLDELNVQADLILANNLLTVLSLKDARKTIEVAYSCLAPGGVCIFSNTIAPYWPITQEYFDLIVKDSVVKMIGFPIIKSIVNNPRLLRKIPQIGLILSGNQYEYKIMAISDIAWKKVFLPFILANFLEIFSDFPLDSIYKSVAYKLLNELDITLDPNEFHKKIKETPGAIELFSIFYYAWLTSDPRAKTLSAVIDDDLDILLNNYEAYCIGNTIPYVVRTDILEETADNCYQRLHRVKVMEETRDKQGLRRVVSFIDNNFMKQFQAVTALIRVIRNKGSGISMMNALKESGILWRNQKIFQLTSEVVNLVKDGAQIHPGILQNINITHKARSIILYRPFLGQSAAERYSQIQQALSSEN